MVWKVVPDILIIIIFFKGCLITGQQRKSNRGINPSAESFKCTEHLMLLVEFAHVRD